MITGLLYDLSQLGLALGGHNEAWWEREVWKGSEERCLEAPFSPCGWHPAMPEGKEEAVFLSLFLP